MLNFQGSSLLLPSDASRGRNPAGGKTLYVSNLTADDNSDDHEGTDPQYPLATIEAALAKVTTRKHDYIFVQDSYDQETFPVTVATRDVHIIGLGNGHVTHNRCLLYGNGEAAITLGDACDGAEIAGFDLGAGASDSCFLLVAACWKVHIHHCALGNVTSGMAALHGIDTGAFAMNFSLIDNCYFSRYLVGAGCSGDFNCSFIANNWFRYYGTYGITCGGGQTPDILSNRFFKAQGAAEGWAINITGGPGLGMIDDNRAMEDGAVPASNPFKDVTGTGTPAQLNAWGLNYKGITATFPA